MPVITSIKPQGQRENRFNVFLDGKFAFSLPAEVLIAAKIKDGMELNQEQVNNLVKQNDFSLIFDKVLKFLAVRPRSEFEIDEYMLQKGWGEKTRNMVLEKLRDLKLTDDEAFARWWIEQRSDIRPEGRSLLKFELRRKGVQRELIDELLAESRSETVDELLAEKIAKKKLERIKSLPFFEIKKKLFSVLRLRGFSVGVINTVVDKLLKKE